jgi:hypothetical protein
MGRLDGLIGQFCIEVTDTFRIGIRFHASTKSF